MVAIEKYDAGLVKMLLKHLDPINGGRVQYAFDIEQAPIWKAATNGATDIVKILLKDPRVDPTIDNRPLNTAISNQNWGVVNALISDDRVIRALSTKDTKRLFRKMTKLMK